MHHDRAGFLEQALLCGLTVVSAVLLVGQIFAPQPIALPGVTIDRLSALMTLLVAGVGAVVYRFAVRYMDGEPGQQRFLHWLCLTVGMAYLLMLATNMLLLFAAWSLTSIGLHQLLTFYRDRHEVYPPARKKLLISRLGDVALLAAIALIWLEWRTLELGVFLQRVAAADSASPAAAAVGLLVVLAAVTKSAQFPFHSWLPETMEAPTPVSALMHAGVINAGGVLLLRFAPLLVLVPSALLLLALVGTVTVALGVLAMWTQPTVKRTLAWSTVSQMGFMMIQCGLAAFPVAALHIVGHGCYKAWSFLRSGELPHYAPSAHALPPRHALALGITGAALAMPALAVAARLTGFDPLHSPGELALAGIVALSIGQLWIALFRYAGVGAGQPLRWTVLALLLTMIVSVLAFALYRGAGLFFAPVLGTLPTPQGPLAWAAALVPLVVFAGLAVLHALLPALSHSARGRALYVHALHGFYVGALADRLVARIWSRFASGRTYHA